MLLLMSAAVIFVLVAYGQNIFYTTIYLHRTMTHNSLRLAKGIGAYMRTWLCCFTFQTMKGWVCGHRKHHRFADQPGDPHSPRLLGVWHLFFRHEKYYKAAADDPEILAEYSYGLSNSRMDWFLENSVLGAATGLLLTMALFSGIAALATVPVWWGALVGFVAYATQLIAFLKTASAVNSFCHKFGYRNFVTKDDSTNLWWLGWLAAGEGWHNNHHHEQKSPKLGYTNKEFDPAWYLVIQPLILLGLAEQLHPTINEKEERKKQPTAI